MDLLGLPSKPRTGAAALSANRILFRSSPRGRDSVTHFAFLFWSPCGQIFPCQLPDCTKKIRSGSERIYTRRNTKISSPHALFSPMWKTLWKMGKTPHCYALFSTDRLSTVVNTHPKCEETMNTARRLGKIPFRALVYSILKIFKIFIFLLAARPAILERLAHLQKGARYATHYGRLRQIAPPIRHGS